MPFKKRILSDIRFAVTLLGWLVFQPARWQAYVQTLDPALGPLFCVLDLTAAQWHNARVQNAVRVAVGVLPLWAACMSALVVASVSGVSFNLFFAFVLGLAVSVCLSAIAGVAPATLASLLAIPALVFAFGRSDVLLIDLMLTPRLGVVLGLASLAIIFVTGQLENRRLVFAASRQISGTLVGLLVGVLLIVAVQGLTTMSFTLRDTAVSPPASTVPLLSALATALLIGLAAFLKTLRVDKALFVASLVFIAMTLVVNNMGREFGREPLAWQLLATVLVNTLATYLFLFLVPYVLVGQIAGRWAGVLAGALGGLGLHWLITQLFSLYDLWPNVLTAAALALIGTLLSWLRPLLTYPLQMAFASVLFQLDARRLPHSPSLAATHPAFWDEGQWLKLYGLDQHLLMVCEARPAQGEALVQLASTTAQRWAAQAVNVERVARKLDACADLRAIARQGAVVASSNLQGDASAILREFFRLGTDTQVALEQSSAYNRQLVLREVQHGLGAFSDALARSGERYARRFQPIAARWLQIVNADLQDLERRAQGVQEIPDPYVVGMPLTWQQAVFVGRTDVSQRIEALLEHPDQPPLLLYGQRRMGKTSLLLNLRRILPSRIVPLVVDLQGPITQARDHGAFLYNLAKGMTASAQQQNLLVPRLSRERLSDDPFTVFDDWLDAAEATLVGNNKDFFVLALDEFESLDQALSAGQLGEDAVMGTLRHVIQHRRRFKVILAGSHTLDEFPKWSRYLINAQTLHLSYLHEAESRRLIEHPIDAFPLVYAQQASRQVLSLTRSHPYLVQLLCSEIVAIKNAQTEEARYWATENDVEQAATLMLDHGRQFFVDLQTNQIPEAALPFLQALARQWPGAPSASQLTPQTAALDDALTQALIRREVIEPNGAGQYHFQVEAVQRWFAQ